MGVVYRQSGAGIRIRRRWFAGRGNCAMQWPDMDAFGRFLQILPMSTSCPSVRQQIRVPMPRRESIAEDRDDREGRSGGSGGAGRGQHMLGDPASSGC